MLLNKRNWVLAIVAVSSFSSAPAFAFCDGPATCGMMRGNEIRMREQAKKEREERERREAQAARAEAAAREALEERAKSFTQLSEQMNELSAKMGGLRGRYNDRIRYDLPAMVNPIIELGNELSQGVIAESGVPVTIIATARKYLERARANGKEREGFYSYWNDISQETVRDNLASIAEKIAQFERVTVGVEDLEYGYLLAKRLKKTGSVMSK